MTETGLEEIKKYLKTKKLVIGTDSTIKNLKLRKLSRVFISSNAPAEVVRDIEHYAWLAGVQAVMLEVPNDELEGQCKRPYSISVIGLLS